MNLFHFQEEAPGMVFWHPNGWTIYRLLENFIRNKLEHMNIKKLRLLKLLIESYGKHLVTGINIEKICLLQK